MVEVAALAASAAARRQHGDWPAPVVILITLPVLILLFSRRAARPAPQLAVTAPAE